MLPGPMLLGLSAAAALRCSPLRGPTLGALSSIRSPHVRMLSSDEDLSKCTVVQLKEKLRAAGLPVSGRKADLIARLTGAAPDAPVTAPPTIDSADIVMPASLTSTGGFPAIAIEACKQ